jgi:hypothetical protein
MPLRVTRYKMTDVSEMPTASIIRATGSHLKLKVLIADCTTTPSRPLPASTNVQIFSHSTAVNSVYCTYAVFYEAPSFLL